MVQKLWDRIFRKNQYPSPHFLPENIDKDWKDISLKSCTWLNLLPLEIASVEESLEPQSKKLREDHNVGYMSQEHKKLYTLWKRIEEKALQSSVKAQFETNEESRAYAITTSYELRAKADALRKILLISLQDYFNVWDKPSIGLRYGFEVVWSDAPPLYGIFDLVGAGGNRH